MYLTFQFGNGQQVAIDPAEFGSDAMGAVLDRLAIKHNGVTGVVINQGSMNENIPATGRMTAHGLSHGDFPGGSLPSAM